MDMKDWEFGHLNATGSPRKQMRIVGGLAETRCAANADGGRVGFQSFLTQRIDGLKRIFSVNVYEPQ